MQAEKERDILHYIFPVSFSLVLGSCNTIWATMGDITTVRSSSWSTLHTSPYIKPAPAAVLWSRSLFLDTERSWKCSRHSLRNPSNIIHHQMSLNRYAYECPLIQMPSRHPKNSLLSDHCWSWTWSHKVSQKACLLFFWLLSIGMSCDKTFRQWQKARKSSKLLRFPAIT